MKENTYLVIFMILILIIYFRECNTEGFIEDLPSTSPASCPLSLLDYQNFFVPNTDIRARNNNKNFDDYMIENIYLSIADDQVKATFANERQWGGDNYIYMWYKLEKPISISKSKIEYNYIIFGFEHTDRYHHPCEDEGRACRENPECLAIIQAAPPNSVADQDTCMANPLCASWKQCTSKRAGGWIAGELKKIYMSPHEPNINYGGGKHTQHREVPRNDCPSGRVADRCAEPDNDPACVHGTINGGVDTNSFTIGDDMHITIKMYIDKNNISTCDDYDYGPLKEADCGSCGKDPCTFKNKCGEKAKYLFWKKKMETVKGFPIPGCAETDNKLPQSANHDYSCCKIATCGSV